MKKGRLSKTEQQFIIDNGRKLPVEQIARKLNRHADTIQAYLSTVVLEEVETSPTSPAEPPPPAKNPVLVAFKKSISYRTLKSQFMPEEMRYIEDRYCQIVEQFREDITATEEMQILLLIKFEILMDRNLKTRHRAIGDIERQEKMLEELSGKHDSPADMDPVEREEFARLGELINQSRSASQNLTSEYIKLEEKHQTLLKDLKATREQRIARIESGKATFLGLLRELDEEEERQRVGRMMAIMQKATEQELVRLSAPHQYEDGMWDQPILNADTSVFMNPNPTSPAQPSLEDKSGPKEN